ncbi:MAG: hypothetical protein M3O09_17845 [Acidobacteriota bacterium]|nr:hypothetical protein [Acidobacteriota bacterium]
MVFIFALKRDHLETSIQLKRFINEWLIVKNNLLDAFAGYFLMASGGRQSLAHSVSIRRIDLLLREFHRRLKTGGNNL